MPFLQSLISLCLGTTDIENKTKHETLGLDCFNEAGLVLLEKPEGLLLNSTIDLSEQVFSCNFSFDWMRIQIMTYILRKLLNQTYRNYSET